jgi:2-polyprenyl-6-methoxyphenol hydroxylase-like FAD-dependent oxidoreductase
MEHQDKWNYILQLDEELLQGGVVLSEWTTFLVKDAQIAFCSGANISAILACQAAIESHLRFDYFQSEETKGWGFYHLIERSSLKEDLKQELHELRKFRNQWVHISDPADDISLLDRPDHHEAQLEDFAKRAMKTTLKTLYNNPWV